MIFSAFTFKFEYRELSLHCLQNYICYSLLVLLQYKRNGSITLTIDNTYHVKIHSRVKTCTKLVLDIYYGLNIQSVAKLLLQTSPKNRNS